MLGRTLTAVARVRARLGSAAPPREELIARHVGGRSFVDVGCMWTIHGALCFAAEDAGAATVTGVDVMEPSPQFQAELQRRNSKVRFVRGDLHEPATVQAIGRHDVVWCSGVLY
ncbi:MAG: tRNA (mo5U34)-methyltransferase, partial [Solirubrobacteraceae bacterium]|nr:tRNA (mo5U34)-methyltransferase [Solirubrobacteraceae bacterium]